MMKIKYIVAILIILISDSCLQVGPKILFRDPDAPSNVFFEHTEVYERYIVNGANVFFQISVDDYVTNFPKDTYYLGFAVYVENGKNYTSFTIKNIQIDTEKHTDYSSEIEQCFPVTTLFNLIEDSTDEQNNFAKQCHYRTPQIFKFGYENIRLTATIEVITSNSSETKTIIYNLSSKKNQSKPFWEIILM